MAEGPAAGTSKLLRVSSASALCPGRSGRHGGVPRVQIQASVRPRELRHASRACRAGHALYQLPGPTSRLYEPSLQPGLAPETPGPALPDRAAGAAGEPASHRNAGRDTARAAAPQRPPEAHSLRRTRPSLLHAYLARSPLFTFQMGRRCVLERTEHSTRHQRL